MKLSTPFASRMVGIGSAFPERRVTNDQLRTEFGLDTNDEWIHERTGIRERRLCDNTNPEENNSMLGLRASQRAMEMAGVTPDEIDLILYATCSADTLIPSSACWLQSHLGAKKAWAMDLNAACSGFVYGVATADQFLRSGQHETILVVGGEKLNPYLNWEDRSTCILFGDGAGAAVMKRVDAEHPNRVLSAHLKSDGALWDYFYIEAGGTNIPLTPEVLHDKRNTVTMKGREIFKEAVRMLADLGNKALQTHGYTVQDLNWLVPHQANLRILEAVAKRLDLPMEKVIINLDRFGNTSAATIPTALDEGVRDGRIKEGDLVLLDAFGAGLTYGSVLLRW